MAVLEALERPLARAPCACGVRALRPRQWTKNALLFAGIVFAAEIGDWEKWVQALVAFAAYCAASSAAYLLNDLRDVELDRRHPVKRFRPIARGELSERTAVFLALLLVAVAISLASLLGVWSLLLLFGFFSLQAAYSLGLKHVVLLDVAAIAGLFVIRAAAGAVAVHVHISGWLLACTALLALFLALAKRRAEIALVAAEATPGRPVLAGYSQTFVDRLVGALAVAAVLVYTAYTLTGRNSRWDGGHDPVRRLRDRSLRVARPRPRCRRGAGRGAASDVPLLAVDRRLGRRLRRDPAATCSLLLTW